jgi:hypothetical protein
MDKMDLSDEQALREVLAKWYGTQANAWQMNDALLNVVLKMVDEMHSCTSAMHFVPMPLTLGNQVVQLGKGYLKKILNVLKDNSQVYLTCARTTILAYKTEVGLAAMGL